MKRKISLIIMLGLLTDANTIDREYEHTKSHNWDREREVRT